MNRRFLLAWVVLFIAWMIGSVVVHGILLASDYARLPHLFRSKEGAQPYFPLMFVAHALMAGAFAWIYQRGCEPRPWLGQGVRFGVVVALLTVVPTYTIYYVVQPMPGAMVIKQVLLDGALVVLLGIVAALLLKRPATK